MAKRKTKTTKKTTKKKASKRKVTTRKAAATKGKTATKKKVMATKAIKTAIKKATPTLAAKGLKVGEALPHFEVPATGGQNVSPSSLQGKTVVLYFYPKDDTPGCTLEGHEFTRLKNEFQARNTVVYGVSRDDMASHEKFKAKQCYTIDLLSDTKGELCQIFDVIKMKNMYGKQIMGIERSTFVIDPNGRLVKEWRKVKAEGHAQEVLNHLNQPV